jgi:hypothetical protein
MFDAMTPQTERFTVFNISTGIFSFSLKTMALFPSPPPELLPATRASPDSGWFA